LSDGPLACRPSSCWFRWPARGRSGA